MKKYKWKRFLVSIKVAWRQLRHEKSFIEEDDKRFVRELSEKFMTLHPSKRFKMLSIVISNVDIESKLEICRLEKQLEAYKKEIKTL